MKYWMMALLIGSGLAAPACLTAQQPAYVSSVASCLSMRSASGGGTAFYNVCSRQIYAAVYMTTGLMFDGYYNNGYMDDIPPGGGRYTYFACPADSEPEDSETGERVTFDTSSYKCRKTGT